MDAQKVLSVLALYDEKISQIEPMSQSLQRAPTNEKFPFGHKGAQEERVAITKMFCHLRWMCVQTALYVKDNRMEKAFRWLGFLQGALWKEGIYSIEELGQHNMPDGAGTCHECHGNKYLISLGEDLVTFKKALCPKCNVPAVPVL